MKTTIKNEQMSRVFGLGQSPAGLAASGCQPLDILSAGFGTVPVVEYVTWTVALPLTDTDIDSTFGDTIDVLTNPKSVPGVVSVDSSFVLNGVLQVDMLAIGFGVHIFAEPFSFTTIGNAIPTTLVSPIYSLDTFTANDITNNAMGTSLTGIVPAILEWGLPAWEAGWQLANAYQFIWVMQQRYQLINELVADVCYFGPYAEAVAAGTSDVPVQPYANVTNARYRDLGATDIFQPVVARRVGSVTTAGPGGANVAVSHPTRDYDLAPVTHGGLRNQGGFANGTPFRKLLKPVLLEQGIPIGMSLQAQDQYCQSAMQQYLSISNGIGGTNALVTFDATINGQTNAGTAGATGLEQTADATPAYAVQAVNTNRSVFKGGQLKLAILIKGFEIFGQWKKYMLDNWNGKQITTPQALSGSEGFPTRR